MKTINKYRKKVREMLFISINKDLNQWTEDGKKDFYSPDYGDDYRLNIDIKRGTLYLGQCPILTYRFLFIPIDFKVWKYAQIVKKHFRKIKEDEKVVQEIDFLKMGLNKIGEKYVKEVRKEKLDKIEKS